MTQQSIVGDQSQNCARLLYSLLELATAPERFEDTHRYAVGLARRAREGHVPTASAVWRHLDELLRSLLRHVWFDACRHVANDNGPPHRACRTCDDPRRKVELGCELGAVIADILDAIRRRDTATLARVPAIIPSDLDEGHLLPFGLLRRSFERRAAKLYLPRNTTRRMAEALERIHEAATQRCFEFAAA